MHRLFGAELVDYRHGAVLPACSRPRALIRRDSACLNRMALNSPILQHSEGFFDKRFSRPNGAPRKQVMRYDVAWVAV